MPTGIFEITQIPDDKVQQVVNLFNLDDPKPTITKTKLSDNNWTVKADFGGGGHESKKFGT